MDINDAGEVVWGTLDLTTYEFGIRLMRRVRFGDADLDLDVDGNDFAAYVSCVTGPVPTDGLCACRFLDIDHDRDVDFADFSRFQQNFGTGPFTQPTAQREERGAAAKPGAGQFVTLTSPIGRQVNVPAGRR